MSQLSQMSQSAMRNTTFNISSFPTSLKTIFPIPFAISQIYRNHRGQVHRPERVNQCTCPHGPKLNIAPSALAYSSNILNCRKGICTIMLHKPSLVVYWNVFLYDEMQSWHSIMMLNYPIRIQITQHIENFYYKHNKYHYLLLPLSSTYRTVTAYSK